MFGAGKQRLAKFLLQWSTKITSMKRMLKAELLSINTQERQAGVCFYEERFQKSLRANPSLLLGMYVFLKLISLLRKHNLFP